jgi:hypothetical protein
MNAGFSLADFSEQVTDEIKALDTLLPAAGSFAVKINDLALGENDVKEGIDPKTGAPYLPLFFVAFKYEILDGEPLDRTVDIEGLKGKVLNDRHTFWPSAMNDMIGLLKGRYAKVGFENVGRLGGLEGGAPGWLDSAREGIIGLKIKHAVRNGETRANFSWFALEEGEAGATGEADSDSQAA